VRIEAAELGRRAGRLLLDRFAGVKQRAGDKVIDLGFQLVVRESA
jgi:DNA-binding LacI/PurR family transcriptional regulator